MTNVNVMDIIIVDLQGIEYDINDIKVEGNDVSYYEERSDDGDNND